MARATARARPLLLALLALTCARSGADSPVVVQAPEQVRGFLDETVTLPCSLQPLDPGVRVTQVTWMRRKPSGRFYSVAVFHPTQGPSYPEQGRLRFTTAQAGASELLDGSLTVSGLLAEDEDNYTCEFATFPQGSGSARTWLRVLAKPQNQVEALEVQVSMEPVNVARCVSTGGRPPARISWSSDLDGRGNTTQTPGLLPGTFDVTSLLTLTPSSQLSGKVVTCTVEHESFEGPVLLPTNLTILYPPEINISGYDGSWYLGQKKATLYCNVRSNPKSTRYDWSTTTGSLPPTAEAKGSSLLIHTVDKSVNTTFICRVTNALGTSQAEQNILLKEPSEDGSQELPYKIIIPIVVLLVLAVAAIVAYFVRNRKGRQNRANPSANGDCAYSQVKPQEEAAQEGTR